MKSRYVFAARPSALARWQTQWAIRLLQAIHPDLQCEELVIASEGDKIADKPLPEIGGKGLFTQELEAALLSGQADVAVHSLKDLPTGNRDGLTIASVPARADARDALISKRGFTLEALPNETTVGTSSLRRAAQVLSARPDLRVAPLRGNVDTRVRKALEGQFDAVVLAGAGLIRLGLENRITQWLSLDVMLPAPAQGALGVQCRADDEETIQLLSSINDLGAQKTTTAEREFLRCLGGGCALPIAAYAEIKEDMPLKICMTGLVSSQDGERSVKVYGENADAHQLGRELAELAITKGARELLPPR